MQALKRAAQASDIESMLRFLAPCPANGIIGDTIHVDGGSPYQATHETDSC
jgi:hypothetical protein